MNYSATLIDWAGKINFLPSPHALVNMKPTVGGSGSRLLHYITYYYTRLEYFLQPPSNPSVSLLNKNLMRYGPRIYFAGMLLRF